MRQMQIRHAAGRFALCRQGAHEPRHIEHHGRTLRETMQRSVPAVRHSLECKCGRTTGMHDSLDAAEADWGVLYAQIPMALPAPIPFPPHGRRRATAHKEKSRG